jgi:hypothetical protein
LQHFQFAFGKTVLWFCHCVLLMAQMCGWKEGRSITKSGSRPS